MISTVGFCAESSPPSAGANAPAEDSIAATRRDLDAIKAARNPAEAPKGDIPHFSVPDISAIAPSEPKPWLSQREKDAKTQQKSANWLVDAMMKPDKSNPNGTSRGDPRKATGKGGQNTSTSALAASLESEQDDLSPTSELKADQTTAGSEKETSTDKERPHDTNVFNPFASYMASWMSPQDYTLLRPVVATGHADAASIAGANSAGAAAAVGAASANPEADSMLSIAGAAKPAYQPATPMENPYLQAISLPPPPSVSTAPAPVAPPTAPSAIFAPPPPMPDAKPVVPDFVKPSDDKYYKPLKRF